MTPTSYLTRFESMEPLDIRAYESAGGFDGLRAMLKKTPEEVTTLVREARLAGRGGAGFDTGLKWSTVPTNETTYVVCNADEGEPGTFKDRFLLRSAPLLVLEGLMIACYAVGAERGYIYVRGEYPEIISSLTESIDALRDSGYLGESVAGSVFSLELEVMPGGGSYVVGDETALLSSLAGDRGYPRAKPPFPTQAGLWDAPTVINNVETLACVPLIATHGPEWFAGIGATDTPGPKLYSVSGHVKDPGVYEFPMGITVGELVEAAGGVDGDLKAVQIGGTAGPVYDRSCLPFALDFTSMRERGGSLGSGALVVMNSTVSMVPVLEVTMRFFSEESCGQCFACRYGTRQLEYMANRIALGKGKPEYLRLMRQTVSAMYDTAFCPFGQSLRLTLTTLLDAFGAEIESSMAESAYLKEVAS